MNYFSVISGSLCCNLWLKWRWWWCANVHAAVQARKHRNSLHGEVSLFYEDVFQGRQQNRLYVRFITWNHSFEFYREHWTFVYKINIFRLFLCIDKPYKSFPRSNAYRLEQNDIEGEGDLLHVSSNNLMSISLTDVKNLHSSKSSQYILCIVFMEFSST